MPPGEVVPLDVGVVADVGVVVVVVGVVAVVGVVGVVLLVVGVVAGAVAVGDVVGVVVVVGEVAVGDVVGVGCWQSVAASWLTVAIPWLRFLRKVGLTERGRCPTEELRLWASLDAAPQSWAASAEDTWSSCPFKRFAWLLESSPELPPQATKHDTANPSPPATIALRAKPIRG